MASSGTAKKGTLQFCSHGSDKEPYGDTVIESGSLGTQAKVASRYFALENNLTEDAIYLLIIICITPT